jgi:multidrug resistance protein MdtO
VRTVLISGIAAVLAVFATIAVFMLSLSEPALRIPLMVVLTFATMFLARASTLGPVFFTAGFIVAYGLTLGDEVLGLALQPATSANAPQFELPEIFFVPPAEALLHFLLWLSLAVALPVAVVIIANLLTGRDSGAPSPARACRSVVDSSTLLRRRAAGGTPARSPGLRRHRGARKLHRLCRRAARRPAPPGLARLADRRHRPARPPAAAWPGRRQCAPRCFRLQPPAARRNAP